MPAKALTLYWDGSGTGWDAASSWSTNSAATTPDPALPPGASDDAVFNITGVTANQTVNLNAAQAALSLLFRSTGTTTIANGTGTNSLTLSGGGITLNPGAGTVTLGAPIVLGAPQTWTNNSTNALTLSSTGTLANGGMALRVTGSGATNFNSVISGSGGSITKAGTGTLTLNQLNTVTNLAVTVNNGIFSYVGSGIGSSLVLPASTTVSLGGGTFNTTSGTANPTVYTFASLAVNAGSSAITEGRGSNGRNVTTFNTISRSVGGTLDVSDAGNSSAIRMPTTPNVNGVVPFITYAGANWYVAAGTGTNGTAYAAYTASTATSLGTATQNSNVVTDVALPAGPNTINTIRFNDVTNSRTVTIGAADTLTVGAGGILVTPTVANHRSTITGGTVVGAASGDLIVINNNPYNSSTLPNAEMVIGSVIADNTSATALTKSGVGLLRLTNAANTYTGKTFLNGGTIQIADDGSLGTTPGGVVADALSFQGGTLQLGAASTISSNRGATLADKGGTINTNGFAGTYSGVITGSGAFTKAGAGTLSTAGNHTYSGATTISGGTLALTGGSLANTAITVASGATLAPRPGTGAVTAGTTGLGTAGASLALGIGSAFDMTDGFVGTFNLGQNDSFTGSGLTIGGASGTAASLTFEIGAGASGTDLLNVTKGVTVGAIGGTINIAPTSGATITPGSYVLINAASGLGVPALTLGTTLLNIGATQYAFSLASSTATQEILTVTSQINLPTAYYKGSINGTLSTGGNGSPTNFVDGPNGVDPLNLPNNGTDVFFTADTASNLSTTLGADFAIKSLTFTGTGTSAGSNSVAINGANTLTLGTGGITVQSGSAAHSIGAAVALGTNQTWTNNSSGPLTVGGTVGGLVTTTLGIAGTGTVILSGNNTYAGPISVTGGALQLGNVAAATSNAVTVGVANGLLFSPGISPTIGSLAGAGDIALNDTTAAGITLTTGGNGGSTTYSGVLGGAGSLVKTGAGTMTLSNPANTYAGNTTVSGGVLAIAGDGGLGAAPASPLANAITLSGNGTLQFSAATTLSTNRGITLSGTGGTLDIGSNPSTYAGVITGTGGLVKSGSGTLTLTGTNTNSGSTTSAAGSILVGTGGSLNGAGLFTTAGSVQVSGGSVTESVLSNVTQGTNFTLNTGTAAFNAGLKTSSTGGDGALIKVNGGAFSASSVTLFRTNNNAAPNATTLVPPTIPSTSGFVVAGGTASVTGSLSLGDGTTNSSTSGLISGGDTSVGGQVIVGYTSAANTRWNYLQVSGGTLTAADSSATGGIVIGKGGTSIQSELYLTGGVTTAGRVAFGTTTDTAGGTANLLIAGGTLYVGSGGIGKASTTTGGAALATNAFFSSGTLGAAGTWSTSLPINLSGAAATPVIIKAADAADVAHDISLSGAISGSGSITKTGGGTLTLATTNTYSGATRAAAGTLKFTATQNLGALSAGTGATVVGESLDLFAKSVAIDGGPAAPTGKIDLKAGNLVVTYGTGGSTRGDVEQLVAFGALNASSAGIVTSAGTPGGLTLGVADTADVGGITLYNSGATIPANSVVVRYTYAGDATLDGSVDTADLGVMLDNFGALADPGGRQWSIGDVNYDASVDTADLGLALDNFGQLAGSGAVQAALAGLGFTLADGVETGVANGQSIRFALTGAALPEPASLGLIGVGAAGLLGRRRRRA